MNRHSTNPWARLRVLLMLPAVALSVTVASASNQDVKVAEKQNIITAAIVEEKSGKVDSSSVNFPAVPDDVFMVVEETPEFPGGAAALLDYLRTNIKYPEDCRVNHVEGRVLVTFIVETDGAISNANVVRGVDPSLDAEALRVILGMPYWKPGKQRGSAVRVQYTVPINFKLSAN